jgi:hypothetical protein
MATTTEISDVRRARQQQANWPTQPRQDADLARLDSLDVPPQNVQAVRSSSNDPVGVLGISNVAATSQTAPSVGSAASVAGGKTMTDVLATPGGGFNVWLRKDNSITDTNAALDRTGSRANATVRVVMESGIDGAAAEMRKAIDGIKGVEQLILSPFTSRNDGAGNWAGEQWTGRNPNGSADHLALMQAMGTEGAAQIAKGNSNFAIQLWNEGGGSFQEIEDSAVSAMTTLAQSGYKGNVVVPSSPGWSQAGLKDPAKVVELSNKIAARVAQSTGEPVATVANRMAMSLSMYDTAMQMPSQDIANLFKTFKDAGVNVLAGELGAGGVRADGSMDASKGLGPDNALAGAQGNGTVLGWSLNHGDGHQLTNGSVLTHFGELVFDFTRKQSAASPEP